MNINSYKEILYQFSLFPQRDSRPTFMEICKHPESRFEEICSRILSFYLNPLAEHGLSNLWLTALWKVTKQDGELPFYNQIECVTEEFADTKKINIVVKSDDFVIAIENKITADLYNPLDIYAKHIHNNYVGKKHVLLVLSVSLIIDGESRKLITKNGFTAVLYKKLFAQVYKELGNYVMGCDQKYLTYMLDFMKTIENMNSDNQKRENDFFYQNKESIDALINRYNNYKNNVLSQQKSNIAELLPIISEKTKAEWHAWQGWDLTIAFNENGNRIGIESSYESSSNDVCGMFHIYISTLAIKDWFPYKDAVIKAFPNYIKLDENCDNRVYLHLPIIVGNDKTMIIDNLFDAYQKMKVITDNIGNK